MRRTMFFLGIIGIVAGLAASAAPLSVCSYVSPETSLRSLQFSMSYRYFHDWATPGAADVSSGRAALDFSRLYDSPNFGYTLTGNAELLLANLLPTSGSGSAAGTLRSYFTQDAPAFGFGGIEASVASGQPQPGIYINAGLGYGRFSDVTPLAKAFKIEKELLNANAITQPLGDSALMAIAKVIGSTYASAKDQVAEVVNQIQSASGVTLDPRQVLKVEDLVLATGDVRNCGWSVQAGVGYQLVDPYNQPRGFLITASADAAFVPNPDGQVLFHAGLSGPLNILNQNTLTVRASYDQVLSETSLLRGTYTLQQVQPLGLPASTTQAATLLLGFVVGRADMGLQVSLSKPANASAWSIDVSISAAMNLIY